MRYFISRRRRCKMAGRPAPVAVVGGPAQAADVEAGKAKAAVCAACHGGRRKALIPNYPHLAGQNAAYLVKQLKAFKDGSRRSL